MSSLKLGESYCFDDVLMEPLLSSTTSRNTISLSVNIATQHRKLILKTPLISSPMDTVTETEMAIKMALSGGLGIIHRFMSIEDQVSQVTKVKRFLQYIITSPYTISPTATYDTYQELSSKYNVASFCVVDEDNVFKGLLTRRDAEYMNFAIQEQPMEFTFATIENFYNKDVMFITLPENHVQLEEILKVAKTIMMKHRVEKIPIITTDHRLTGLITLKNIIHWENNKQRACINDKGELCVGAAIGIVGDYMERLSQLVNAGVDLVCIDVANGFNTNVFSVIKEIRSQYPELVIMAGNVCNAEGFQALQELDVDCIRVGIGNGSICTTRLETGVGKGQFSAVSECFTAANSTSSPSASSAPSSTSSLPYIFKSNIICDGGSLGKTGNKVKALATGASAVMLGRTLASTIESPGQIIYRNGRRFKYIRGMASTMANLSKQEKTASTSSNKLNTKFTAEGVDGEQELSGSVEELIEQLNGGIKSGLSYLGCDTIEQLHEKRRKNMIKFNLVTSIGMSETGIRVKTY